MDVAFGAFSCAAFSFAGADLRVPAVVGALVTLVTPSSPGSVSAVIGAGVTGDAGYAIAWGADDGESVQRLSEDPAADAPT